MLNVLIVEDEALERRALRFLINKYFSGQLEVAGEASNGEEAAEKALLLKPDIILMDINMPFMDGLQASELIKQQGRNIEIAILTAYDYFEYARRGIKIGVSDYLLKPFSDEEFLKSVREMIKRIQVRKYLERNVEETAFESCNNEDLVKSAKKYIQMNYRKEISLDEIANHISISSYYLSRIFSKSEGMTYKDYLIKLRMEKAKQLIMEGKKTIKEISIEVGYTDQNYFSKAFKKYTSKSPKEFSKKIGGF